MAKKTIKYTYECQCGAKYSEGLHNSIIKNRKHKFETCGCGRELRNENNMMRNPCDNKDCTFHKMYGYCNSKKYCGGYYIKHKEAE